MKDEEKQSLKSELDQIDGLINHIFWGTENIPEIKLRIISISQQLYGKESSTLNQAVSQMGKIESAQDYMKRKNISMKEIPNFHTELMEIDNKNQQELHSIVNGLKKSVEGFSEDTTEFKSPELKPSSTDITWTQWFNFIKTRSRFFYGLVMALILIICISWYEGSCHPKSSSLVNNIVTNLPQFKLLSTAKTDIFSWTHTNR